MSDRSFALLLAISFIVHAAALLVLDRTAAPTLPLVRGPMRVRMWAPASPAPTPPPAAPRGPAAPTTPAVAPHAAPEAPHSAATARTSLSPTPTAAPVSPALQAARTPASDAESAPGSRERPAPASNTGSVRAEREAAAPPVAAPGAVDAVPHVLASNLPPPYPERARRAGQEGRVLVRLHVRADGAVAATRLVGSSGYDALDRAALRAAAGYRFEPARSRGRAVEADVLLPFNFELRTPDRR